MSLPAYSTQTWTDDDGSGTVGTPYTAARMSHIENGVRDATILPGYSHTGSPADANRVVWKRASDGGVVAYVQSDDAGKTDIAAVPPDSGGASSLYLRAMSAAVDGDNEAYLAITNDPSLSSDRRRVQAVVKQDSGVPGPGIARTILTSAGASDFPQLRKDILANRPTATPANTNYRYFATDTGIEYTNYDGATWTPTGVYPAQVGNGAVDSWSPTGALYETFPRAVAGTTMATLVNTLLVAGGIVAKAGVAITSASFVLSGTVSGLSHQWFCIIRQSDMKVMAVTADDLTTAWATNTVKTLNFTSAWTPTADTPIYVAAQVNASTQPFLDGTGPQFGLMNVAPVLGGRIAPGSSGPVAVNTVLASPSGSTSGMPYAYLK